MPHDQVHLAFIGIALALLVGAVIGLALNA